MKNYQDEPNITDVSVYVLKDLSETRANGFKMYTAKTNWQEYFFFQSSKVANFLQKTYACMHAYDVFPALCLLSLFRRPL